MGLRTILGLKKKKPTEKKINIGSYTLVANYQHELDEYLERYQYYSKNFPRIAKYIEQKYKEYVIVDVGANIGDTLALLRSDNIDQHIHLIEGDPIYVGLLERNLHQFSNATLHKTFLGEETSQIQITIDSTRGTANINVGTGVTTDVITLDDLVKKNSIKNIKLLKTDTDGFDFKILRGSFDVLKRDKPVIFFEYDNVFLSQQNDDGLSIFKDFLNLGYKKAIYYDNFGKFLLSTDIDNSELLAQLYSYINKKEGCTIFYYDVCLFHEEDEELANEIISKEIKFYA